MAKKKKERKEKGGKKNSKDWECSSVVTGLSNMCMATGSIPNTPKQQLKVLVLLSGRGNRIQLCGSPSAYHAQDPRLSTAS